MTTPAPLDAQVLPEDQRRAADLALACLDADADAAGDLLADLLDAGAERALATTAVLARNCAATLVAAHGTEAARRILEATRWDAAVAE